MDPKRDKAWWQSRAGAQEREMGGRKGGRGREGGKGEMRKGEEKEEEKEEEEEEEEEEMTQAPTALLWQAGPRFPHQ